MNPLTPAPDTTTSHEAPMIDARQAAHALGLPFYWFSERRMRTAKRIPHYLLGNLVRFRLAELEAWTLGFAFSVACSRYAKGKGKDGGYTLQVFGSLGHPQARPAPPGP